VTVGYVKMLIDMGVTVHPPKMWPIEWIDFRLHPCPHWLGVEGYRRALRIKLPVPPVVLCSKCFTILDGWHRVAAYWLEGYREVPVQLADRHLAGAKEYCKMADVAWIETIAPFADLDCVSGSYLEDDWKVPAFGRARDLLVGFRKESANCPTMRKWERVRSVCFLGVLRGKRILDIGTRESYVPHWLASQGAIVDIVEADTSFVHKSKDVTVHQGDILHLPKEFEDEMYDVVLCTAVVKSLAGWGDRRAVKEMVRVLKPGGLLAITVDFGQDYKAFPSKATGVRLYNKSTLYSRIIRPSRCELVGPVNFDRSNWDAWPIKHQSPKAFEAGVNVQVAFVLLRK